MIWTVQLVSNILGLIAGAKIGELIPENIKSSESVESVKSKIKKWVPEIHPYRVSETYVYQVAFVN